MICIHLCPSQESANDGFGTTERGGFRVGPAGDAGKVAGDAVSRRRGGRSRILE